MKQLMVPKAHRSKAFTMQDYAITTARQVRHLYTTTLKSKKSMSKCTRVDLALEFL